MFIPIGDENPTQRTPYVNYAIIAFNTLIFLLFNFRSDFDLIVKNYGFTPANHELLTTFTSMFMHAGFFHIIGNMLYLAIFGDNVEDILGHYYILFYLACGVSADLLHYVIDPSSALPAVGASGAISGVLGFYLIFFPWHRVKFWYWLRFAAGTFYLEAFWAIGFWFILQLLYGLITLSVPGLGGVAYWAHIGGFACGAAIAIPFKIREVRQINKVVDEKVKVLEALTLDKRELDPNLILSELLTSGNETEFLKSYNRFKTNYGEARLAINHHIKAAEILMDRSAYNHAVDVFYSLLLLYPNHPLTPKIKYYLGMILAHELNQPKEGLRYLRQLSEQPDLAIGIRQELEKIERNVESLRPQKMARQLSGKCMVIRQGEGAIDTRKIGKLVAEVTGKNPFDIITQIANSHYIIARDIDAPQAIILSDYLHHQGVPVVVLDETMIVALPESQLILKARLEEQGLHLESAIANKFLAWSDIYMALAGRITHREPVLERKRKILTGLPGLFKRRVIPVINVASPLPTTEDILSYTDKEVAEFAINIVSKDFTGLFRLNSGHMTVSGLPDAPEYLTKLKGLCLLARELLKKTKCPYSRPGMELLALEQLNEQDWQQLSFLSIFYFNEYTRAILNLKRNV